MSLPWVRRSSSGRIIMSSYMVFQVGGLEDNCVIEL